MNIISPFDSYMTKAGIGPRLRAIREKWGLSLREVEERSAHLAKDRNKPAYLISSGWLNRLEREEHEVTVSKLVALSIIYSVPTEHLLRYTNPGAEENLIVEFPPKIPDETMLLTPNIVMPSPPFQRGIIGKRDLNLDPMIPPGSLVHIDTRDRAVAMRNNWTQEFQRPIYFLTGKEGDVCGWCELDKEWLTVIPHPLSPATSRRWEYRKEIETIGRVVAIAVRLSE